LEPGLAANLLRGLEPASHRISEGLEFSLKPSAASGERIISANSAPPSPGPGNDGRPGCERESEHDEKHDAGCVHRLGEPAHHIRNGVLSRLGEHRPDDDDERGKPTDPLP
jgi:hypothetical protein